MTCPASGWGARQWGNPLSLASSAWVRLLYHQQPKNMLVSYSPKKLGYF
ncbi:hypothetical protein OG592_34025 [Streptomyces avidinii]|nr:hypothetical protein OG592_34025 [Streptomyces avidinii]